MPGVVAADPPLARLKAEVSDLLRALTTGKIEAEADDLSLA